MSESWPAGDAALLVAADVPAGLAAAITARGLRGVLDVVPGAATVLVVTQPGSWDLAELAREIVTLPAAAGSGTDTATAEIGVSYDGADLAEVAALTGLSVAEVIARHRAPEYRVGWLGFSPGFGYLTGLDPVLAAVPRLATPRQSVPAGSVAIAGGLTAVYPVASPGGWRLLGRSAARLWDQDRDPPSLLAPGMRVRFVAADAARDDAGLDGAAASSAGAEFDAGPVEVLRPGPLATIQDLGRPGYGHLGVPRSGAADVGSLRLANRLVGNPDGAAGIEVTLGRAALRFHAAAVVALTGATAPASVAAGDVPYDRAFVLPAGSVLRLGAPVAGLRSYLAVGGGIDVPAVLGSRSADLLSRIGPRPLRAGDRLPVGERGGAASQEPQLRPEPLLHREPQLQREPQAHREPQLRTVLTGDVVSLRIVAGPRDDWFEPAALGALTTGTFQVSPASNRTGLRLTGPELARARAGELPSEGMVTGALQVPPDGQPILLLADHPATGGYPVIAVVHSADIDLAAQLRPGQRVRFQRFSSR